jgi:hypothetical protein
MNKKAKMYVGLGVVAVVAYYFYHQSQMKKAAAVKMSASGKSATTNRIPNPKVDLRKIGINKK